MKSHFFLILFVGLLFLSNSSDAFTHPYESPYQCLVKKVSKRSGKTFWTVNYIHPKKNWLIYLSSVKKKSSLKVANLYTKEGRYDGSYKGVYPGIKMVKFGTFWPGEKGKTEVRISKIDKSNCKEIGSEFSFELNYLSTLECMDPKNTGSCKALGR